MNENKKRVGLEQWQQYNPLDKKENGMKFDKSNKFPYCKPEKATTIPKMTEPKVSVVGIVPVRNTSKLDEVGVMIVGKPAVSDLKLGEQEKNLVEIEDERDVPSPEAKPCIDKQNHKKMPAIVATVGTIGQIQFSQRQKPRPTPMTKLKGRVIPKPLIPVPPNSRMSKRTSSLHSTVHDTDRSQSRGTGKTSLAPPSTPVIDELSHSDKRDSTSARSVDDIIKSLRSSRQDQELKSSADMRIDQLLQQVLGHSEEWTKKEIKEDQLQQDAGIHESMKDDQPALAQLDEDVDVSDTVSTLASQISAPTGIPDVAAILQRKSSQAVHRGPDSENSDFSSPVFGACDPDSYIDATQALKDLNQTLDVRNEDIIRVDGQPPPLGKIELGSEDEGYYDGIYSGSGSERFQPADLHTTINTAGRIHHLCLLAANKATYFNVDPESAALSRLLHTSGNRFKAMQASGDFRKGPTHVPPAPPPSEIPLSAIDYESIAAGSRFGSPRQPAVLEQVEEYQRICEAGKLQNHPVEKKSIETEWDTSKIDPLDFDAWRRVADNILEHKDMTQQGQRISGKESSMWRLLWDPAPPKMLIPPVAVKAALFPKYHGAQLASGAATGVGLDLELQESLSVSEEDAESKRHEFNLLTINRKHKSEEDLSRLINQSTADEFVAINRTNSAPYLPGNEVNEDFSLKINTDYSTAMMELGQQRAQAMQKEQEAAQLQSAVNLQTTSTRNENSKLQIITPVNSETKVTKSIMIVEPKLPEKKISEAEISRQGGKAYVPHRRKSKKKSQHFKKNSVIVQEVRKLLSSYDPAPLKRSRSVETGLSVNDEHTEIIHRDPKASEVPLNRHRSRSLPRVINFQEFLNRYNESEIDDTREWVRDIWNEWFDEVIPPSVSDEESWSSSSLDSEDEMADLEPQKVNSLLPRPDSPSSAGKPKVPNKIHDVLSPVVVLTGADGEYLDEEVSAEIITQEVDKLGSMIENLFESQTATKAIFLSRKGALYRKLGQIKLAKEDLNEALTLEPRLSAGYWHRHLIHLLENKYHEALDDLNVLLKLDKTHIHAYRSRADIFALLGDFTMAIVNYSQAIKLKPDDEDAYFQRAQLYEKKGDMLLALEDYGSVVNINPGRTDALLKRGKFHFSHQNWHSTIADFTLMIQREPQNALARTFRGRAYASLKQYESALSDLSAAIHLDPSNWRAFYHRACLLRTLAPEKSLQDFSCSLMINETYDNAMSFLHRGILYTELKRYPEAVVDFEEALRLDHRLACAYVNIGLVFHQITRNYTEAIRHFTNAIKVDPTYTRAYMCRADSYAEIGDHKEALHDVTRAIILRPDDRHLYLRRGQLLLQLGDLNLAGFCVRHISTFGEGIVSTSATQQAVVQSFLKNHDVAIEGLGAACRVKPLPHMYVLLGKTFMKAKRFKDAIFNFKNALDLLGSTAFSMSSSVTESTKSLQSHPEETSEIHFLLGQCHTQLEQNAKALNAYNNALKANPDHALAFYRRGLCRLKMDNPKGVQDLNRALAVDPTLFEAFLSRAAFYGSKGRYSKAILNCNEALRLRPNSVRAYLYRGALKFHISSYQLAVHDLTGAIKLENKCSLAFFNRAACYQKMKKFTEALKDYSVVLMLEEAQEQSKDGNDDLSKQNKPSHTPVPLKTRVCVNRGLLYLLDLGDPFNAALDFECVIENEPKNIKVLHTMALCYHKLRMLNEAVEYYSRCLTVDPYFLTGYIGRGEAHGDAGNVVLARRDYQRALRLNPACLAARINLGYSMQSTGKFHQAWLQFSRAIELDSSSQQAYEGRAVTCLRAGNMDAAFQDISAAFRVAKPTARLHTARGVIHQYMGDVRSAMADYQRAIKLDGKYSVAFFNAAALYLRDRRFREALAYLDRAVQLTPEDDAALTNRGITLILLNDSNRALQDFDNAIQLNNKNAHTFYNRGNLLAMLQRYEDAELDYSTAFTIDPSDYGSLKKRADVRGKLGKRGMAIADYRTALKLYERTKMLAGAA